MKIGIDARVLYSANLRGIGKYLFNIINIINDTKYSARFFLFYNHWNGKKTIPNGAGIIEKQCEVKKGDRLFLWEQLRLPKEAKKEKVDILHCPANTIPLYQPCPTVVTLHDTLLMESDEDETKDFLFYTRKIIPIGLRKVKKIITVSHNSKKDIIKYFKIAPEKIEVIYHGISPQYRKIESPETLNLIKSKYGISKKYMFSLGAIGPRKNTLKVIESFLVLKNKYKLDIQLVISGLQNEAMSILSKKTTEMGIKEDVVLIGYISDEDLVALYSFAEISLYLSLYEGFGFPALESMACGCPVIASNLTSLPELVEDPDSLANPRDTEEIVEKSIPFLKNASFRSQKINDGLQRIKKFSWEKAAEKTLTVYKNIAFKEGTNE